MAAAALAGVVACVAGLVWRQQRMGGLDPLDSRGWYTPREAAALFDHLDRLDGSARIVYAATGLTIDMVFPVTATEYELLRVLSLDAGRVVTHDTLLRRVWSGRNHAESHRLRAFVKNSPPQARRRCGRSHLHSQRARHRIPDAQAGRAVSASALRQGSP